MSWSVLLEARLARPVDPSAVTANLRELVTHHPQLGAAPEVLTCRSPDWPAVRAQFADAPYRGHALLRVASAPDRLLVAAHHGATDGLGLLAVLGAALGTPLSSRARGIGARAASHTFAASAVRRLAEAVAAPPARITPRQHAGAGPGDQLVSAELPAAGIGSAALVAATARAVHAWNARHGRPARRLVAGLGVSRRDGTALTPRADSTFLRLRVPAGAGAAQVRSLIAAQPPEPDFPPSRSAAPAVLTRALAARLGSTFLASNLGAVHGDPGVLALAFHPTASGRSGVAVGAATAGSVTTFTLRARRHSFDAAAANTLLAMIVHQLSATESPQTRQDGSVATTG